jgi:tryptophan synthase alpha chain
VSEEAEKLVNRMRQFSSLPIAVGFGISSAAQVADVSRYADAVVVGSAIVAEMERCLEEPELARHIDNFLNRITGFS